PRATICGVFARIARLAPRAGNAMLPGAAHARYGRRSEIAWSRAGHPPHAAHATLRLLTRCSYGPRRCYAHGRPPPRACARLLGSLRGSGRRAPGRGRWRARAGAARPAALAAAGAGCADGAGGSAGPVGARAERLGQSVLQRGRALDELELAQLPVRVA